MTTTAELFTVYEMTRSEGWMPIARDQTYEEAHKMCPSIKRYFSRQ